MLIISDDSIIKSPTGSQAFVYAGTGNHIEKADLCDFLPPPPHLRRYSKKLRHRLTAAYLCKDVSVRGISPSGERLLLNEIGNQVHPDANIPQQHGQHLHCRAATFQLDLFPVLPVLCLFVYCSLHWPTDIPHVRYCQQGKWQEQHPS